MSNTPTTQPIQASTTNTNSGTPSTTPAISIPPVAVKPTPSTNKFSVSPIPAFKRPANLNYAAAASSKSKLSPPAINGKDVTAVIQGASATTTPASVAVASVGVPQRKPSVEVKGASVPGGNVNSTAVAPNAGSNNGSKASVAAPNVPSTTGTAKPALDIHSFFTGASSPSPSAASLPGGEQRRSVATYDPQSALPIPSNLSHSLSGHPTLSSNSQSFAPRQAPTFVPQQQQPSFPSGYNLGPPSPFQQHQQQQHQSYLGGKSPAQNINGGHFPQNGTPQRSGSYVGSPVMQHQMQQRAGQPGTPTGRQFPTSPRLSNAGLPQAGMMGYPPQGWQQQQQQPFQGYQPYYPGMQQSYAGGPNVFVPPQQQQQQLQQQQQQQLQQQQLGGSQAPLVPSGTSTPSGGIRTPIPSSSIPPSPSPASTNAPQTPSSSGYNYASPPPPQAATTPLHQQFHPSLSTGPPRTPNSPFSSLSGTAAFAAEFKPNVEATSFSPSPRKSAAIKIVNPKKKAEEDAAAAAIVAANAPVETAEELAKKEADKKEVEKKEAEKKAKALQVEKEKVKDAEEKAAAVAKVVEEAKAKESAAKVVEAPVVEQKVATPVVELSEPAQTLVEARQAIQSSASSSTSSLPSFLPAKPVNGTPIVDDKPKRVAPEPLDLSSKTIPTASLPSALLSARNIDNLHSISYPDNIKSPRPDLNADAAPGKYRYDRDFLMQFMIVCVEKPEHLPNLEAIGMVDAGADGGAMRSNFPGGAAGRRTPSMGPPAVPNRGGTGSFGRSSSTGGAFTMGSFQSPTATTSEGRFNASLAPGGGRAGGGFPARPGQQMVRNASQGGAAPSGSNFGTPGGQRVKSNRGTPRNEKGGGGGGGGRGDKNGHTTGDGFEDAAPLAVTDNRWTPTVIGGATAAPSATDSPEFVQRKVKALLNKLTLEKFDSISDQILAWADKSIEEVDGRILRQVIALIFEKATDEANWSEMYARLCRKLMEKVSPNVKDETVKLADGTVVSGGTLFRKYLLNRCQEDYESGWKQKEVAAAAAAGKAADDNAKKEANEAAKKEEESKEGGAAASSSSSAPKEAELLSDEYYAAQKAKRRGLGLVRFIGELYRLSMLTERIMHECIKKLLANTENPEEEDVESLCRLLTTVGKGLDNAKAKQHMDIYFIRMATIANNMKISSRIRFMTQDVLELRKEKWQPRHDSAGPKLISEIHSDAQKATEEASRRVASSSGKGLPRLQDQLGSRPNSYRGNPRNNQFPGPGADGWSAPVVVRPAKAGDLSSFGKIRDSNPTSLGPTGAFANRGGLAAKAKEPTRVPSNPFAALEAAEASSAPSSGRTKLVLAPRTVKTEGGEEEEKVEEGAAEEEEEEEDDGSIDPNATSMSRAEGERRAENSVKEFFSVKNISEGVASVEALPVEYRGFLITALADAAVQKKSEDVNLTRNLFADIVAKKVVPHAVMLQSLTPLVVVLIDTSVDVPSVYTFASQLLAGAGVSSEEVGVLALKMESDEEEEEEVERGRASLLSAFAKLTAP